MIHSTHTSSFYRQVFAGICTGADMLTHNKQ